jgi:hypothetical protein
MILISFISEKVLFIIIIDYIMIEYIVRFYVFIYFLKKDQIDII